MKADGLQFTRSTSVAENFIVESGNTFPDSTLVPGRLFNRTGITSPGLYIYTGDNWVLVSGGGSGYDTPEEVRDALQTLTGANRLDASAIQNLPASTVSTLAPAGTPAEGEEWIVVSEA